MPNTLAGSEMKTITDLVLDLPKDPHSDNMRYRFPISGGFLTGKETTFSNCHILCLEVRWYCLVSGFNQSTEAKRACQHREETWPWPLHFLRKIEIL